MRSLINKAPRSKPTVKVREIEPEYIRHQDVVTYCANSQQLVTALVRASWLAPIIREHKMTIYRLEDVKAAMNRLEMEGLEALAVASNP